MKSFRTVVSPAKFPFSVSHHDRIVSIGSCFSENIGKKFSEYKFNINVNPFGQQYNPCSVANSIQRLLEHKHYTEDELVFHDELYHSFDHHGSFSRSTILETLNVINQNLEKASVDIRKATILFLTFGTAHVFELKRQLNGEVRAGEESVVSNCHKLSGSVFNKRLLSPEEIVHVLDKALSALRVVNPGLRVILTVSPVRYFAFGHYENTVSKAHLFTAIYKLQQLDPSCYYFPAYELVMDDLRDYRFFAEDMLHPNYQATDYVWEKLCETVLPKRTMEVMRQIDEVMLAARHKPRNPDSEAHKKFVQKNLDKINRLETEHLLNFADERRHLSRFLKEDGIAT